MNNDLERAHLLSELRLTGYYSEDRINCIRYASIPFLQMCLELAQKVNEIAIKENEV